MTSQVDVVNMALAQIAARAEVQSINPSDGSQAGDVAGLIYQPKIDALSRSAHWNCLRLQAMATLLRAAQGTPENPQGLLPQPPVPWLYQYAIPPDCLKVRYLLPSRENGPSPPIMTNISTMTGNYLPRMAIPYAVAVGTDTDGNQIKVLLTNLCRAQMVYTGRIDNPDLWDSAFLQAAVSTLASWMVNPLNRNKDLAGEQAAIAKAAIDSARISDGNEGITTVDHTPDWIAGRGAGWNGGSDGYLLAPWDTMIFPSGAY